MKEFALRLDERATLEKVQQEEFLSAMKEAFLEDQIEEFSTLGKMCNLIQGKFNKAMAPGFKELKGEKEEAYVVPTNENLRRSILVNASVLLNLKVREQKEVAMRKILQQFGFASMSEKIEANLRYKGKSLMNLKEYPRMNLKRAFYRWYLQTTDMGQNLFQRAADNMVLYTNVNKTTAFYRMFETVRVQRRIVTDDAKRRGFIFYLFIKRFYDRPQATFFEKFKAMGASTQLEAAEKLLSCANSRKKEALKIWFDELKATRSRKQQRITGVMNSA